MEKKSEQDIKELAKQKALEVYPGKTKLREVARHHFAKGFIAGMEEKGEKWTIVENGLPEEKEGVLVTNNVGSYDVGFILNGKWMSRVGKVIAWRRFGKWT